MTKKYYSLEMKKIINNIGKSTNEFLIIGNDNTLNQLKFNMIKPTIITVSVNRIWMIFMPDIIYIIDPEILIEIQNAITKKEITYSAFHNTIIFYNFYLYPDFSDLLVNLKAYAVNIKRNNSVYALTEWIGKNYKESIMYMYGISLIYNEKKNHFWSGQKNILNKRTKDWEIKRLNHLYYNFKLLKSKNYNMISVMEKSKLNNLINVKSINSIYIYI